MYVPRDCLTYSRDIIGIMHMVVRRKLCKKFGSVIVI